MSDILRQLRLRRKGLGLSAKQVAEDLHVSPATVTMWETGMRAITLKRAEEYAGYLGLRLDVLAPSATSGALPDDEEGRTVTQPSWAGCCGEDSSEARCGPVNYTHVIQARLAYVVESDA